MTTLDSGETRGGAARSTEPSGTLLQRALDAWREELTQLSGPDTLLGYRDLPLGTLDLTTAHPSGLAELPCGAARRACPTCSVSRPPSTAPGRGHGTCVWLPRRRTEGFGLPGTQLGVGLVEWVDPSTGARSPGRSCCVR